MIKLAKRYYWLKLQKDFFKRHDILIIESMPNGKDYILFYLKMLVESVTHDGELRFSETIPYNEEMLATVTNTNVDIVRSAMKVFIELGMMEILDDKTIYMAEVQKMIGSESDSAERVRNHRKRQEMLQCNANVTNCNTEKEIDIDIEIDKEKDNSNSAHKRFVPPTIEQIDAYCLEKRYEYVDPEAFFLFYDSKGWMVGKNKMKRWVSAVANWNKTQKNNGRKKFRIIPKDIPAKQEEKQTDDSWYASMVAKYGEEDA